MRCVKTTRNIFIESITGRSTAQGSTGCNIGLIKISPYNAWFIRA